MPTFAGQMTQVPGGNPQWRACDGSWLNCYQPIRPPFTQRPHTGVSTGTYRDYIRNVGQTSGSRGLGGWKVRIPRDPSGTWYISTADDSSETTIPGAPTPAHPPAGVR